MTGYFADADARGVAAFARSAFTFWPFNRPKNAASKRKITASPLKLLGVTVKSTDSLCAISVRFNNESPEKAITISTAHTRPVRLNCQFGCPRSDWEYARKSPQGEGTVRIL